MWLFCKSGFYSAVVNDRDDSLIHVRAMLSGDLERLFETHCISGVKIVETPDGDYRFRCDIPREEWRRIVSEEADAIDYVNFKNEVLQYTGTVRDRAYMDVHHIMARAKKEERGENDE